LNDSSFCKSFHFNVYRFNKYHLTDNSKRPVPLHYFGCLIRGTAEIISKNEKISLKPNEIFYIPKGLKYQSKWYIDDRDGVEFYSFGFEYAPIDKSFVLQKITCTETAAKLFEELCHEIPITDRGMGKLYSFLGEVAENLVQATARDCLREAMLALDEEGYDMRAHVHDEVIVSEPIDGRNVDEMAEGMGRPISWAPGLPLRADGYETPFYKKD
jgi:hypothetical protein